MAGFIFGGNTPWTYDELQRKRSVADALVAANIGTPRNVGEGLNAIGRALAARSLGKKAEKRDAELKGEFQSQWDSAFGGFGGGYGSGFRSSPSGTWTPDAPGPKPTETHLGMPDVASGGLSFGGPKVDTGVADGAGGLGFGSATMTPQEMIIAGAEKHGLNPIDVATAISYETGGKFDPMIAGPTTQWGTHRGLIQFGEPQAAEHGVDFSSPDAAWRSQLDPNTGAVWDYLKGAGVQPGMGLPEVYSAINAGSVGRMNASDANNGGAPGTVADKVAGMGPHREKAAQFLGGTWTPTEGGGTVTASAQNAPQGGYGGGGMDIAMLAELASNPYATPGQRAVVNALMQQQMQMMDPMYQMEMQKAQLELAQMQNPQAAQPESLTERTALLAAAGIDPNSPEGKNYLLTGELPEQPKPADQPNSVQEYEYYKQGALARGETPMAYEEFLVADEKASVPPGAAPGLPPDEEALRGALGKKEGEAWSVALDAATVSAGTMQDFEFLDELITMAPQGPIQGRLAGAFPGINSAADAFNSVVKRVAPTLRAPGSGATSDIEYDGMLKSLPQLSSKPEANRAISAMMKAKAQINIERGKVIASYQNGEIGAPEARKALTELNSRSIMTPELKAILGQTAPPQPGTDMSEDDAAYLRSLGLEP